MIVEREVIVEKPVYKEVTVIRPVFRDVEVINPIIREKIITGCKHMIEASEKIHKTDLSKLSNNQLCFQCLAPNSKLERFTSNNSLCKTFVITGIENEIHPNIKVYPNPITDYLMIEQLDPGVKNVEIIDINGKEMISRIASGQQRIRIDTTHLKSGLYILKIESRDRINTQLIMKE